jgi:stress-induced morphogen
MTHTQVWVSASQERVTIATLSDKYHCDLHFIEKGKLVSEKFSNLKKVTQQRVVDQGGWL